MGVTYKLTDDIVRFIIDEKHKVPVLSCRELVDRVSTRFQRNVSKSSVNDILREAHITSRRGRKTIKDKFEIPAERKAQLLASMPDVSKVCGPLTGIAPQRPAKEQEAAKPAVAFARAELTPLQTVGTQSLADAMLEGAFTELFPRPGKNIARHQDLNILEINDLQKECAYRALSAAGFKLELENGTAFYLDSRWQKIQQELPVNFLEYCPIERALTEAADLLLNNIQPAVIREIGTSELLGDFFAAMEGKKSHSIVQITVIDPSGRALAHFSQAAHQRREYILGVETQLINNKEVMTISPDEVKEIPVHTSSQPLLCVKKAISLPGFSGRSFLILNSAHEPQTVVLTNASNRLEDAAVVRLYAQRHPAGVKPAPEVSAAANFLEFVDGDYLKHRAARMFFGGQLEQGLWQAAEDLKAEVHANEQIRRLDFDGLVQSPQLLRAMEKYNIYYIKDISGRPVWLKA